MEKKKGLKGFVYICIVNIPNLISTPKVTE